MSNVVIIDYGSGNLHSAAKAFERMADETGHKVILTDKPEEVVNASHVVLPGVGAFGDCKRGLESLDGMIDALEESVINNKNPFLGICVGMQLLANKGLERGEHSGLGWIEGEVVTIKPSDDTLKIPHMGWNELIIASDNPLFNGIEKGDHAYFVHSYHFLCRNNENVLAEVDYGGVVTAAVNRDNIYGVQFHPEKSQETGMKVIRNFLDLA